MTGSPPMVLPRPAAAGADFSYSREEQFAQIDPFALGFGSSMPITFRPGTTATRAESALIERAISSERLMTRDDFIPGAGSSS